MAAHDGLMTKFSLALRRRHVLSFASFSFLGLVTSGQAASLAAGEVPLWPGRAPGGGGPRLGRRTIHKAALLRIATPTLRMVRPQTPNGTAVLIAPGGGYHFVEERKEGEAAAQWLAARGVTAFILTYRLPGEGWFVGPRAPLQDAQRALRLIRAQGDALGLDPQKIGSMGFSAGGHLMGMLSTRFAEPIYSSVDNADTLSARPDFTLLAYPVITLKAPYNHTWTRVEMVGKHPSDADVAAWSVETHVGSTCPPVFLAHAKDDPVANIEHSRLMQAACRKAGVSADLVELEQGGHGFAMGEGSMGKTPRPPVNWTPALEAWMRGRNLV
ncbi:alpha/beta hydrolase fold domain-containing protein [Agrobacterium vitis]|uniref:Alpha/beta hydrolase fold domain-containing protein n=2 Tax=Agrobacterium vitis TaxID=373 RepID=A0A7K1RDC7_AGRVI|nr:alpha/beta hydrolase fold domain-containing protein [Agrobacterium vitis]